MRYVHKDDVVNHNVSEREPLREFLQLFGGLVIVVSLLTAALFFTGRAVETRLSSAQEERLQSFMANAFKDEFKAAPATEAYLNAIADKLLKGTNSTSGSRIRTFRLMCGRHGPNAFAIPGRIIALTGPLISKLATEEGVAFVIAHELGHFENRDHLHGLGQAFGTVSLSLLSHALGLGDTLGKVANAVTGAVRNSFSREQEARADAFAVSLLRRAYGSARGAREGLSALAAVEKDTWLGGLPGILMTHPPARERLATVPPGEGIGFGAAPESPLPESVRAEAACQR